MDRRRIEPDDLKRGVHDNLRNLGLDVLEVVNLRIMGDIHAPAEGSIEKQVTALAELQRQGLVRHIGLSNVTPTQIAEAQGIARSSACRTSTTWCTASDDALVDELASQGIAYVPFFPLGGFTPIQSSALSDVAQGARRDAHASGACLAAASLAEYLADSGHVVGRASAGKLAGSAIDVER